MTENCPVLKQKFSIGLRKLRFNILILNTKNMDIYKYIILTHKLKVISRTSPKVYKVNL